MKKIRVLVVEDSLTVRKRLVEVLAGDSDLEVVAEAPDGQRAIELCQSLRPDVMTLDMMLPLMTGVAVTEYVMAYCPTPILIVSASTNRGELFKTYEALAAGALDVLEKPTASSVPEDWARRFVSTVKLISRIKVITHPRARLMQFRRAGELPEFTPRGDPSQPRVVAIGASTGGPAAVLAILRELPASFPLPILVLIHLGLPFSAAMAEWLDGQSAIRVRYARDGEPLPTTGILMAPPDRHLVLRGGQLCLTDDPERHSCRPSVDVLFESLAREMGSHCVACLLTGMGRDGAQGLLAARQAGATTWAQNEASSTVFGMPGEAIRLGAAQRVLSIEEIAPALVALTSNLKGGRAF
jgi:two-component system, chemotaxis family, protein-glutamate methylesterase/glutaminase